MLVPMTETIWRGKVGTRDSDACNAIEPIASAPITEASQRKSAKSATWSAAISTTNQTGTQQSVRFWGCYLLYLTFLQ